ncbi:MAG: glycosyltransferase [Eubacterium sp.]|nr:glycosyltransferase [Eubacterium sp.]
MKISVILTSYNHEKFLRQSIESVLNQTYQDFEFLIVDDCSTDRSWDIICEYKKKYPQIITIRHDYNWHGGSIDDVVKNYISGDYIAVHHSDDLWMKNKLNKQIEALRAHPECVAVFTNAEVIDDNGDTYTDENGFYYHLFQSENRTRQEWLHYFFYHGNCLCHPSILVRKDVYAENDFFRKGLRQIPDFVKWIQICRSYEIYVLPEKLVKFRIHSAGKNTSGMRAETQIRSSVELFLMLNEYAGITDRQEFLGIFPEAEAYCKAKAFIPEYAFGKVCTQEGVWQYTRLYGIQLLYHALNDPQKAKMMKSNYAYTKQTFMDDNGRYDIFGVLPEAFEQTRSLYVDRGKGFHCGERYCEQFTLKDTEAFSWTCSLEENYGMNIRKLRFDPSERIFVKVKLAQILVNEMKTKFQAENALYSNGEWQYFVNLDPIYTIEIPNGISDKEKITVTIQGEMERLEADEIGRIVMDVLYEKRDRLYEYQNELSVLGEKYKYIQGQLQEAEKEQKAFKEKLKIQEEISCELEEQLKVQKERDSELELQLNMQKEKDSELESQLNMQKEKNCGLEMELQSIKSSRWYRFVEKMRLTKKQINFAKNKHE